MEQSSLTTLQDPIRAIWHRVPKILKACFLSAFCAGVLCHLFMITNKMINWDDLMTQPDVGGGPYFGRWLQFPLHEVFSKWGAPALNGVAAVLFASLAACFVVALLEVQSLSLAVLVGILMTTFPPLTSAMFYMDLVPMFMMAMLFACLAAYVTRRFRFGFLFGAGFLVLSMALYQAYFPVAVVLLVLGSLEDVLQEKEIAQVLRTGFREILCLALGMVLYLFSIVLSGYSLADYKGMGNIGQNSPGSYLVAALRAIHRYFQYFSTSPDSYMKGGATAVSVLVLVLTAVLAILVLVQKRLYRKPVYLVLYLLLLVLVPLSAGLVYVMSIQTQKATTVMVYGYIGFYLLPVALLTNLAVPEKKDAERALSMLSFVLVIFLSAASFFQVRLAGQAYYRMYLADRRMQSFATRILASLEQQDGYTYGDPILVAGDVSITEETNPIDARDLESIEFADMEGMATEDGYLLPDNRSRYIELFLGVSAESYPEGFDRETFEESSDYQDMAIFPAEGSIKQIDGIWVVRIGQ